MNQCRHEHPCPNCYRYMPCYLPECMTLDSAKFCRYCVAKTTSRKVYY